MVENFIFAKYDASYIIENNIYVKSTYINLHKIWTNQLYTLKRIVNISLVYRLEKWL